MRRYLTDRQLAEHYSVSRATIWRWVQQGRLPQPIQISPGTTRFSAEAIEQRDREREAATLKQSAGRMLPVTPQIDKRNELRRRRQKKGAR